MSRFIPAVGKAGPAFNGASLRVQHVYVASTTSASVGPDVYSYDTYAGALRAVAFYTDER